MSADPIEGETVPTRKLAERVAKSLGCIGAHAVGEAWAPCPSREDLDFLIANGSPAYREWRDKRKQFSERLVLSKEILADIKMKADAESNQFRRRYRRRSDAEDHAQKIGCSGSHLVATGFYAPCSSAKELTKVRGSHKPAVMDRTQPMGRGVASVPGAGLVSGNGVTGSN
jgi:hypothetical protein